MFKLDRRKFLQLTTASSAALVLPRAAWAADANPSMVIHSDKPLAHVPVDFTGLSYETSQLVFPNFFSATNAGLVAHVKTLGESGVLRLGGNLSEFTVFSPTDPPESSVVDGLAGPDPGKRDKQVFTITPRAIRNLSSFLNATGWKLIYGLNLAGNTPENAAEEAKCVAEHCGAHLLAFQFGNEPDLFKHNGDPKDRWKYPEYIAKWKAMEKAVRAAVPHAPLAGPDTSYKPEWVDGFARDTKGDTMMITAHYYAEGPPTDSRMTIERLLTGSEGKFPEHVGKAITSARNAGMPYRMSEGNTCYNAGKKGVSDTFASALWVGDFMAQIAALNGTGVNLHGGANGLYTPIAGDAKSGFVARPIFYGMMMMKPLFGATMLPVELSTGGRNISAYAAQKHGKLMVFAFNKSDAATTLDISGKLGASATVSRLTGPSIEATSGVMLAGAAVSAAGTWSPTTPETLHSRANTLSVDLPAYSAAVVQF